jgi:hypothetical protein
MPRPAYHTVSRCRPGGNFDLRTARLSGEGNQRATKLLTPLSVFEHNQQGLVGGNLHSVQLGDAA